jgi:molybdate transport system substrate-binding protein
MHSFLRKLIRPFLFTASLLVAQSLSADQIVVAVSSNFASTAKHIALDFEQSTGHKVVLAFGSTGQHYAQILSGAPFDIYLAADDERPSLLEQSGVAVQGSRFTYAFGQLVLWSGTPEKASLGDLAEADNYRHLAIANPKLAPYGLAAVQALQALGLFDVLQAKLVRGENVAQVFQFVESGAAELGILSLAQVQSLPTGKQGSIWVLPKDLYQPIRQQAVLLRSSTAAREFMQFLESDSSRSIIASTGYALNEN